MKVVLLCHSSGSDVFHGPSADVAGQPVIWHAMHHFTQHGFQSFVICLDTEQDPIKDYFLRYDTVFRDAEITLGGIDHLRFLTQHDEQDWNITFLHTGPGRSFGTIIQLAKPYLDDDDFIVSHGDILTSLNMAELLDSHRAHGKIGSLVVVRDHCGYMYESETYDSLSGVKNAQRLSEDYHYGGIYVFSTKLSDVLQKDVHSSLVHLTASLISTDELCLYPYDHYWIQANSPRKIEQIRVNAHVLGFPRQRKPRPVLKFR